ncbi:hypothetical protein [Longimicrobium sp.]|uniref:hypothetical protein n=1 Tax=Longimicrobium sp. TaxID=2029185 RepID=UPI002B739E85|nr:hypothetical protein [Longimicrobium sp.]HSU15463.1 hypothetical protein [Longimicrobium sp.]
MFGLEILDVILGLVFVYLLLSLICSAVNEYIAGLTNRRGTALVAGIEKLLDDASDPNLKTEFFNHRLVRSMYSQGPFGGIRAPSYLPARTFAMALLDVMNSTRPAAVADASSDDAIRKTTSTSAGSAAKTGLEHPTHNSTQSVRQLLGLMKDDALDDVVQQIATDTDATVDKAPLLPQGARRAMHGAVAETRTELQRLHDSVEVWFNNSMDRVSGSYKRRTQMVLFFIGLFTALAMNADTLDMWRRLSTDDKLRDGLAAQASAALPELARYDYVRSHGPITDTTGSARQDTTKPIAGGDTTKATTPTDTTAGADALRVQPADTTDSVAGTTPPPAGSAAGPQTSGASGAAEQDSVPLPADTLVRAKAAFDSASALLRRTQLNFGWGWDDAVSLGLARHLTPREAARRQLATAQAQYARSVSALGSTATRADSLRMRRELLRTTPLPVYTADVGGWRLWPILAKLLGILLTAFALSLGAPFWFDTLNKIINIRSAGRAPDEKAKSPEAPGKRLAEQATR